MHIRFLVASSWVTVFLALVSMIIGHSGNHELSWKINQISTYAAIAPHDRWVSASMLLSCLTLAILSILIARIKILGEGYLTHTVPLFAGATISGLLMLAYFKETAMNLSILKNSGFAAIRQQSFHDAGLLIFFYSAILLVVGLGFLLIAQANNWKDKIVGSTVALLGAAAFPLMTTAWPGLIGVLGAGPGLKQRASLLSLWLAIVLVLAVVSIKVRNRDARNGSHPFA